jgi:deoxyribodipyrimidine photo-lyase
MQEEADTAAAVRDALPDLDWRTTWGHTLIDPGDLPFAIDDAPDVFSPFRKAVEKGPAGDYPAPEPPPDTLPPPPDGIDPGEIPDSVEALGLTPRQPDTRRGFAIRGGETAGLERLDQYVWERDRLRVYKETRNGMLVQAEVVRYEAEREQNRSTYWLTFELLWRDFFRVYGAKHGDRLFWPSGPKGERGMPDRLDEGLFAAWREGRTGLPLVDASMRELAATGFMSNRGRQNAASFFVKHLGQPWWVGAAYYEAMLVDYDVTSNWGNWAYVAGVGSDPRDRYFDVELQAKKYDPETAFLKHWLPVLDPLPPRYAIAPYDMSERQQDEFGVRLGKDYPAPVIDYKRVTGRLRAESHASRASRGSTRGDRTSKRRDRRR